MGILPLRVDISGTQTQFKRHNQITPCHQNTSAPIYFFIALSSQSKESLYSTITSELVKKEFTEKHLGNAQFGQISNAIYAIYTQLS